MPERAYTVSEIDELREVAKTRYLWGTTAWDPTDNSGFGRTSRSYNEVELEKILTERVKTYMHAGITAEDIRRQDQEEMDLQVARRKAWEEQDRARLSEQVQENGVQLEPVQTLEAPPAAGPEEVPRVTRTKLPLDEKNRMLRIGFGKHDGKWFFRIDLWKVGYRWSK